MEKNTNILCLYKSKGKPGKSGQDQLLQLWKRTNGLQQSGSAYSGKRGESHLSLAALYSSLGPAPHPSSEVAWKTEPAFPVLGAQNGYHLQRIVITFFLSGGSLED